MNKTFLIVLNILFFTTACENEDGQNTIYQVNIAAQGACMEAEMEGLTASLCVLDTNGISKTEFAQNENFSIALTFQNNIGENIKIKNEYLNGESVMIVEGVADGLNHGKPYTSVSCEFVGNPNMEIPPGGSYVVSSPWVLQEGIRTIGLVCKGESNEYLAVGSYRVIVSLDFIMEMGDKTISVEGGNELGLGFDIM